MKYVYLSFCALLFSMGVFAQEPVQSFGVSLYGTPFGKNYGLNYSYRNNFKNGNDGATFSWTLAPALALRYDQVNNFRFIADVPFLFCYNLGYGATSSDNRDLGFFIGGGAGAHFMNGPGLGVGPEITLGMRGKILRNPLEFRINYHADPLQMSSAVMSFHLNVLLNQRL